MVYLFSRNKKPFLITLFAQWMLQHIAGTNSPPRSAIPAAYSRVTVVLFVAAVLLFLMCLTKASLCQFWTAGERTWPFWFSWHCSTSSPHKESPRRIAPTKAVCPYAVFDAIIIPCLNRNIISQSGHHDFPNRRTVSFSNTRFLRLYADARSIWK